MTPVQLKKEMIRLCGKERGNRTKFAALLGVHRSTIGRYLDKRTKIPEVVAIAARSLSLSSIGH